MNLARDVFQRDKIEKYKRKEKEREVMKGYKRISRIFCAGMLVTLMVAGCGVQTGKGTVAQTASENLSAMEETVKEAEIYVKPVENITEDFIRGMDASAVLAEEESGVVYYDFEGNEQDVMKTLAQAGITHIRLRVWNDPRDEKGNGYGGGNNDVATAIALGKRATQYGMKVCIDFHYSDFWADPKKQMAPKAWADMEMEEKRTALYDFTVDSLQQMLDAGVDVAMVQIGNEINHGMAGEKSVANVMELLKAGSEAVRSVAKAQEKNIDIAVHYTDIQEKAQIKKQVLDLKKNEIDYDIFAVSYYPFWHGDFENMKNVLKEIQETSGKKVMIAETSYCYTSEDGDGYANSLDTATDLVEGYPATVQGQASLIRDVISASHEAGAIGVFYWEGTWIPVGTNAEENQSKWETYGSGWASSYAAEYDPKDAGLYYGGCSWDNQAMFDFTGHPLPSLKVFKYLKNGATAPKEVMSVKASHITLQPGETITMPATAEVSYNDGTTGNIAVDWDKAQIELIDTMMGGAYEVSGTLEDGSMTVCEVEVVVPNMVKNHSFEEEDTSMWKVAYEGTENPTDIQQKKADSYTGEHAFHFYQESADAVFSIEQTLTDLEPGRYRFYAYAQGGDVDETASMELYAITSEGEQVQSFMVNGWNVWQNPEITEIEVTDGTLTVGIRVSANAKSWGTLDDFTVNKLSE